MSSIDVQQSIFHQHEEFLEAVKKKLFKMKEIEAVVLFGSFAREDYSLRHSDLDLMIFLDRLDRDSALEQQIKKKMITLGLGKEISPHVLFQCKKLREEDNSLLVTIAREGQVLFTKKTIIISKNIVGLLPYNLVRFDTTGCRSVVKNRLQRFLYGYTMNKKRYQGIIDEEKVFSAGKSAILAPEELQKKILLFAQKIGVRVEIKGRFYK